jgi:hypothetical protein
MDGAFVVIYVSDRFLNILLLYMDFETINYFILTV